MVKKWRARETCTSAAGSSTLKTLLLEDEAGSYENTGSHRQNQTRAIAILRNPHAGAGAHADADADAAAISLSRQQTSNSLHSSLQGLDRL